MVCIVSQLPHNCTTGTPRVVGSGLSHFGFCIRIVVDYILTVGERGREGGREAGRREGGREGGREEGGKRRQGRREGESKVGRREGKGDREGGRERIRMRGSHHMYTYIPHAYTSTAIREIHPQLANANKATSHNNISI